MTYLLSLTLPLTLNFLLLTLTLLFHQSNLKLLLLVSQVSCLTWTSLCTSNLSHPPCLSVTKYTKKKEAFTNIYLLFQNTPPHLFKNFVFQELNRYRLACTTDDDYHEIASLFHTRLLTRGYPSSIFFDASALVTSRTLMMEKLRLSL